ncbi:MAG: pyruvate dehydrogenase [Planctomycetes bacterium]|nr:pyruvate dehydrogenase [Planctomycetota bacterium]
MPTQPEGNTTFRDVPFQRPPIEPGAPGEESKLALLMKTAVVGQPDLVAIERITARAFAQTQYMIHVANTRKDKRPGDPKVGGHPASCASAMHVLAALHLFVRRPADFVCCKPHASPVDHSLHHLMQLFRRENGTYFTPAEQKRVMHNLRKFATAEDPDVFQSYHARTDPDSFHFLPSGSVGIPPVVSVYLALAYRYAADHRWRVPESAHFWSLIGDSEFREGSLLECLPDVAERDLARVTWIVDYNRQNLDGTRIPNEKSLRGADCDRIERTAAANGWRVIQVRHGSFRKRWFAEPDGDALRELFEGALSDYEYQMLMLARDPSDMRRRSIQKVPRTEKAFARMSDDDVVRLFRDVGGHDLAALIDALTEARNERARPTLVIAHTIKGWNLECEANPSNHSALPNKKEVEALLTKAGLSLDDPFALFPEDSAEGRWLAGRRELFRKGIEEHVRLRAENRDWIRRAIDKDGGIPDTLGIDLSLFPVAHTQWMWGQIAAKLVRIGTADEGGPETATSAKALSEEEQRWKTAADFVLTLSPDVGTSTNISPAMDSRIYGPDIAEPLDEELEVDARHPQLVTQEEVWTRHIRFEIAEANCMSAVAAFGKMAHYTGLPFFPIMTVYDFFIKRALDQLYYNLYWGAEFVLMGTPSGVTLSSEGAQHSWKSDIQIPNLITWEPLFAVEVDWILADAIKRHMEDTNEGRRGVLIRAVTRGIPQKLLLEHVRTHAKSKAVAPNAPLAPQATASAGTAWGGAVDEATLPAKPDVELLEALRADALAGAYYWVDWRGYAGYEPGENVVQLFVMGSPATEALEASKQLLERGIFANVIVITSPELLLGILGEQSGYRHLLEGLGIDGDLHAAPSAATTADSADVVSLAGRRVPIVAVCDGEAGLVDNIGSIVGVKQRTLAVRKFSKCGRPDQIYAYQHLDAASIVEACGQALAETALEDLRIPRELVERLAGRTPPPRRDWRALWPQAGH